MLALEHRAVFARSWQLVAHQGQLAEAATTWWNRSAMYR
jgi:hypothetical protein